MTLAQQVLSALEGASRPLDDDELAGRLHVARQQVNQVCRRLEARGELRRHVGHAGKIVNELAAQTADLRSQPSRAAASAPRTRPAPTSSTSEAGVRPVESVSEDEVKAAVAAHLEASGYTVTVAWGRAPGVDIEARRSGCRVLLEAKGSAPKGAQQHNYFLNALGELVQRMADPDATYGLALPDSPQYRGLVERLPALARQRMCQSVFFVARRDPGTGEGADSRSSAGERPDAVTGDGRRSGGGYTVRELT